jgi:RNase P subunit RPR2
MKYCPVCKIEYSDKADFCKKCEAHLLQKEDVPKNIKPDYKRLIKMCLYTGAFIVFIMILVYVYSLFIK